MICERKPIVLSLHPKWEALVRSGKKTIELRRRFPAYLEGAVAFIYCTSPERSISATIILHNVMRMEINELWRLKGEASCVEDKHFRNYFKECEFGTAIEIAHYNPLKDRWTLQQLRESFGFTAPQSWCYASEQLVDGIGG